MTAGTDLRARALEFLRQFPEGQLSFMNGAPPFFAEAGFKDLSTIQVEFHRLYLEGVVAAGSPRGGTGAMSWPFYFVTDYGRRVLEGDHSPHDPEGYLDRLRSRVPELDRVTLLYLSETLSCYRRDCQLAAAVMLGCAAEKLILLLVDAFANTIADPSERQAYERDTRSWMISRKFDGLWKRLEPASESYPYELRENLHGKLHQVFELIRSVRNDAGHPTGHRIDRETNQANLVLFPTYCDRICRLIKHLNQGPK